METQEILQNLPGVLLPWYQQNKRDLPWRKDRDPYHIWVSEIMLQQTRVEAVKGYYARFLQELPEADIVRKGQQAPRSSYFDSGYSGWDRPNYGYTRPAAKPSYKPAVSSVTTPKTPILELNKGDMVQHTAFGKGMVLSVMKMGGDALLEIAFDQIGTKKLMAKTASAHMKKL